MNMDELTKAIESIIFISDKPVSLKDLKKVFSDNSGRELKQCADNLVELWNSLNRGITLQQVSGGYQFRTIPEYSVYIAKYMESKPFKLSRAALEVLSIIAYKQPVTKIEVEGRTLLWILTHRTVDFLRLFLWW